MNSGARIRLARPDEADHLTALATRSKAYWGYDASFMEACVPALTISPERLTCTRSPVSSAKPSAA